MVEGSNTANQALTHQFKHCDNFKKIKVDLKKSVTVGILHAFSYYFYSVTFLQKYFIFPETRGQWSYFQDPHSYRVWTSVHHMSVTLSLSLYLFQFLHSNWLLQVMWHKNYWWHHSTLSTRPNDSTTLVTSVKVSWLQPRAPEVSFENWCDRSACARVFCVRGQT